MLQSINALSLVLTTMNGRWIADEGDGLTPLFSASLFLSIKLLNEICWKNQMKIVRSNLVKIITNYAHFSLKGRNFF